MNIHELPADIIHHQNTFIQKESSAHVIGGVSPAKVSGAAPASPPPLPLSSLSPSVAIGLQFVAQCNKLQRQHLLPRLCVAFVFFPTVNGKEISSNHD